MINIEVFNSGSKGNMYLVSNDDTKILLECGIRKNNLINTLWKEKRLNVAMLDACLVSHFHKDHSESIEYVNQYIDIYANEQVAEKFTNVNVKIIGNQDVLKIGSIRIKVISVYHGEALNTAFIFRDNDNTIFFGTDFAKMGANLSNIKFNSIFIEINYIEDKLRELINYYSNEENLDENKVYKLTRQLNTHLSLENAINVFLKNWDLSECGEIIAIHISEGVGDREIIKNTIESELNIPCYCANFDGGY